jgi:hypothetical protein
MAVYIRIYFVAYNIVSYIETQDNNWGIGYVVYQS